MNHQERLDLKRIVNESNCEDNTENIRRLKHSVSIRDDLRKIDTMKKKHMDVYKSNLQEFTLLCQQECRFLFDHYTDIFNKVINNELDLIIMAKLLGVLKQIEDGEVDQHEGSAIFGKILKELYIDSAIKRGERLDKEHGETTPEPPIEGKKINWKEYKHILR
jgi:hypothetical protein